MQCRHQWTLFVVCLSSILFLSCDRVPIERELTQETTLPDIPTINVIELDLSESDVERLLDLVQAGKNAEITSPEAIALVAKLQEENPFVSLRDRLAYEADHEASLELPNWTKPETNSADEKWVPRAESLKLLHSEEVSLFIQRNNNGVRRTASPSIQFVRLDEYPGPEFDLISDKTTQEGQGNAVDLPSDDAPSYFEWRKEHGNRSNKPTFRDVSLIHNPNLLLSRSFLSRLHLKTVNDFAPLPSWGYVESLDRVSGFKAHSVSARFETDPWELNRFDTLKNELYKEYRIDIAERHWKDRMTADEKQAVYKRARNFFNTPPKNAVWLIKNMQLVSLLKHDTPRVYNSNRMPDMNELQQVTTRDLNEFESQSLSSLVAGEEVSIESHMNRIQMLGAIRATKSCVACHIVSEGRLLGAFSYDLVRNLVEE